MVRLSLTPWNVEESAYAYVLHAAMLLGPVKEDYRSAYELASWPYASRAALHPAVRPRCDDVCWAVSLWRMRWRPLFPIRMRRSPCHATGLFVDASWALFNEIWFTLLTPDLVHLNQPIRHSGL